MWCQVQATSAMPGRGCPLVRCKHAMCVTPDGHIYLYGGKSMANQALRDLWRFDTGQNQWEEVVPRTQESEVANHHHHPVRHCRHSTALFDESNTATSLSRSSSSSNSSTTNGSPSLGSDDRHDPPPSLQEHTIIAANNKLYIFGGEVGYSSDETPLWIFDLTTARWVKHCASPKSQMCSPPSTMCAVSRPLGRRGHTAVLYKNLMCLYGGYQDLKGSTSELWSFNIGSEEWTLEGNTSKSFACPPGRHSHSAVVFKDSMFVYGGMTDLQIRGDFWSWNFKTKTWNRIKTLKNPGELSCHSAILALDSMFLYGGERANGTHSNELWRFRFGSQTWENVLVQGIIPGCRIRHVAIANPFMNVFGDGTIGAVWQTSPNQSKAKRNRNRKKSKHRLKELSSQLDSSEVQTKDFHDQSKKSISMCFDDDDDDNDSLTLLASSENAKQLKIIKSHSFKLNRKSPIVASLCRGSATQSDEDNEDLEKENSNELFETECKQHSFEKSHENDIENNPNIVNDSTVVANKSSGVRMRPRRPILQKQRPFSDFYGAVHVNGMFDSIENSELKDINEKQIKRRSVQESMSYYSLCFPTPPATLKFNRSPSNPATSPALKQSSTGNTAPEKSPPKYSTIEFQHRKSFNGKVDKDNCHLPDGNETPEQEVVVKRRENSSIKRRMRRANLELRGLNNSLTSGTMHNADNAHYNAYYSLSLDISPDFEKELRCGTTFSTPSNDLHSTRYGVTNSDYGHEMAHIDLDILEDYLEPEEMLEIVTETTNANFETSSTLKMKTIQKTPGRTQRGQQLDKEVDKGSKDKQQSDLTGLDKTQPHHQHHPTMTASVSHSSSGYQSLLLADTSGTGSFDCMSDPSTSNSPSFSEQQPSFKQDRHHFVHSLHQSLQNSLSLKLSDTNTNTHPSRRHKKVENIELKVLNRRMESEKNCHQNCSSNHARTRSADRVNESKTRSTQLYGNRLSHWEPNIKEVIREVIVPGSPAMLGLFKATTSQGHTSVEMGGSEVVTVSEQPNETSTAKLATNKFEISTKTKKKSFLSIRGKKECNGVPQHWQLCMYVFGGKEEGVSGVLNKQSMTIWKLYI